MFETAREDDPAGADTGDTKATGNVARGGLLCAVCAALVESGEFESPPQDANVTHSANTALSNPRLIRMLSPVNRRAERFTLTSEWLFSDPS
ncbi:hypothetical protein QCE63_24710 [Caballeronia sp. LZ065]|uniref:hypothetical protein n=1 Tax=Caballeronia sp. LZ065 TaxID=3038571 RepID=UPI00285919CA|nr:hypothetical protein [Caballeronia sp. LZ065]MDR5782611.1 hypothetical protein [Caballeronia sp. LZ065]